MDDLFRVRQRSRLIIAQSSTPSIFGMLGDHRGIAYRPWPIGTVISHPANLLQVFGPRHLVSILFVPVGLCRSHEGRLGRMPAGRSLARHLHRLRTVDMARKFLDYAHQASRGRVKAARAARVGRGFWLQRGATRGLVERKEALMSSGLIAETF
jgi:hypothetical protein